MKLFQSIAPRRKCDSTKQTKQTFPKACLYTSGSLALVSVLCFDLRCAAPVQDNQNSAVLNILHPLPKYAQLHDEESIVAAPSSTMDVHTSKLFGKAPTPAEMSVYVYDLPHEYEVDLLEQFPQCHTYQWAFEVIVPKIFRNLYKAVDPSVADFFLVPFPVKCFNNFVAKHNKDIVNEKYMALIQWLDQFHPWFRRSGGKDHIFIFPSGQGPQIFPSFQKVLKHSVFLLAEGDRSQNYTNSFKDIIVPGFSSIRPTMIRTKHRDILALFRGSTTMSIAQHNGTKIKKKNTLRHALMDELGWRDAIVFSNEFSKAYEKEIKRAKFIICPRGITPWTRRVFDGIFAGAVPVVISDDIEFPFETFLDWSKFSVKVSEKSAVQPRMLATKLQALASSREYEGKVAHLQAVQKLFDWNEPHVVNGILWQLYHRRRRFKHGSFREWD